MSVRCESSDERLALMLVSLSRLVEEEDAADVRSFLLPKTRARENVPELELELVDGGVGVKEELDVADGDEDEEETEEEDCWACCCFLDGGSLRPYRSAMSETGVGKPVEGSGMV